MDEGAVATSRRALLRLRQGFWGGGPEHAPISPQQEAKADVNAAVNIHLRYTALRLGGPLSTGPGVLSSVVGDEGKLLPKVDRR